MIKNEVVIPIQTIGFYNIIITKSEPNVHQVVIPIQTIGFYNLYQAGVHGAVGSCHTYPNDRLLQQVQPEATCFKEPVVIPIQTIGFYNVVSDHEEA